MDTINLVVPKDTNMRIDKYLSQSEIGLTRNHIQKIIEENLVVLNNKIADKKAIVKENDEITVTIPKPVLISAEPQNIDIEIVYEDNDIIIVNKPRGMVVHPANGNPDKTLVNALMYHCSGNLSSINGVIRPGIIHRIDKDTSGILIVAKNDNSHVFLSEQIKGHSFKREYVALVDGHLKDDFGTIDKPIGRNERDRKKMIVTLKNSKNAITDYEVLDRFAKHTLVKCTLHTGRTHQIRVHFASLGHPVTGDGVYGPKKQPVFQQGQLLHAKTIGFIHPTSKQYVEFTADIPKEFQEVLNKLKV